MFTNTSRLPPLRLPSCSSSPSWSRRRGAHLAKPNERDRCAPPAPRESRVHVRRSVSGFSVVTGSFRTNPARSPSSSRRATEMSGKGASSSAGRIGTAAGWTRIGAGRRSSSRRRVAETSARRAPSWAFSTRPAAESRAASRGRRTSSRRRASSGLTENCVKLAIAFARWRGARAGRVPGRWSCTRPRAPRRKALEACLRLGRLYRSGDGIAQDPVRAAMVFERGCDAEDQASCAELARQYADGEGVTQDLERAAELYEQACGGQRWWEEGDGESCYRLAEMYQSGTGVERDDELAESLLLPGLQLAATGWGASPLPPPQPDST